MGELKLHADCRLVTGTKYAAIYDLTRRKIFRFPIFLAERIRELVGRTEHEIVSASSDEENSQSTRKLLQFLIEKELATFNYSGVRFIPISVGQPASAPAKNAIVDVGAAGQDFVRIVQQLDSIGCKFLQIRILFPVSVGDLIAQVCRLVDGSSVVSVEFVFIAKPDCAVNVLCEEAAKYPVLARIVVLNADEDMLMGKVLLSSETVTGIDDCGKIGYKNLCPPDAKMFDALTMYNGCLASKVSVAENGEVRHCPSIARSYGGINDVDLHAIVTTDDFRSIGMLSKDHIDICRSCEFRYACTDCRAYVLEPSSQTSKPSKCRYDPASGEWNETT